VFVAAVDAFARARRREVEVLVWLRWLGAWVAPFLAGLAVAEVLALTGATPVPPPAPVAPALLPLDGPALAVLGGVAAAMALALLLGRYLAGRPDRSLITPAGPGPAVAVVVVLSVASLALWLVNPYAGLLVVPAAHLWMLAVLSSAQPRRRVRALLLALGALPVLLVTLYYLIALSMDPLSGAWYLLMLVTGHIVSLATSLIGCLMLGVLGAASELVARAPARPGADAPDRGPALSAPGSYAGAGLLTRARNR
jgi:hypothetical protein